MQVTNSPELLKNFNMRAFMSRVQIYIPTEWVLDPVGLNNVIYNNPDLVFKSYRDKKEYPINYYKEISKHYINLKGYSYNLEILTPHDCLIENPPLGLVIYLPYKEVLEYFNDNFKKYSLEYSIGEILIDFDFIRINSKSWTYNRIFSWLRDHTRIPRSKKSKIHRGKDEVWLGDPNKSISRVVHIYKCKIEKNRNAVRLRLFIKTRGLKNNNISNLDSLINTDFPSLIEKFLYFDSPDFNRQFFGVLTLFKFISP